MELLTADDYVLARWLFERSLAAIYVIAFANALNQFPALLGENGLAPVRVSRFWSAPSLFCWHYSDRLVSAYGAFGSVTRERFEVVVEGSSSEDPSDDRGWREYEFKAKPGDPARRPPQVAPYHYRLDWLMWFLPLSVRVGREGLRFAGYEGWFRRLVEKLLEGDRATLKLLRGNPFPERPPRWIRARFYRYAFTKSEEHRQTGHTWKRNLVGEYLPPVSRDEM